MLGQLLTAFFSSIINRVVTTFKGITNVKFYFVSFLIALLSLSLIFKDTIEVTVRGKLFSATDFRECRNPYGLQDALEKVTKKDTNIISYTVFLYEPKNRSFYKKMIITNSEIYRSSPTLQTSYLKDQISINKALDADGYYLVDDIELRHPDMKPLSDMGVTSALYYRLSSNGSPVGEIMIRFREKPSAKQLDSLLKTLSPFLYVYII